MKEYIDESYHIEVSHESGSFESDMDHLTTDPKQAYQELQVLKEKYPGQEIKMEKIIKTTSYIPITENQLEEIIKK